MAYINDEEDFELAVIQLEMFAPGEIFLEDDWEIDLRHLVAYGKLYEPKRIVWRRGRPTWCHENSCKYWNKHRDEVQLVTGYAYGGNRWFRHSWLVNPKSGAVWETSHRFSKYFGYVLTEQQARDFVVENLV